MSKRFSRGVSAVRSHLPCMAAAGLWGGWLTITLLGVRLGSDDLGRLFSMAVVCATIWAMLCARDSTRGVRPAAQVWTDEQIGELERIYRTGVRDGREDGGRPQPRTLKSVN